MLSSATTTPARDPAGDLPLVTVAVLAYNRREALRTTLTKLREELDWPAERLEVIVVDNASEDGTAGMVETEFPDAQVIVTERNTGISGWNRAFEAGAGDWFLVLDDDCYVVGDALRRALTGALEHEADLVSFRVLSPATPPEVFNDFYDTGLLGFWGCSALISGRAVRELGGFDPGIFIWGHEAEFVARLLDRGWRHLHLPEITSVHMKSVPDFHLDQHRRRLESAAYIAGKLLVPRDLVPVVGNLLLRVLTEAGRRPRIILSLPAVLRGVRSGLRNRAPVRGTVSRLYRTDCIEFVSPLLFVRGPLVRYRQWRRSESAEQDLVERRERFWRERAACYPRGTGTLSV
jgi:GT2 family glycosyltransferase